MPLLTTLPGADSAKKIGCMSKDPPPRSEAEFSGRWTGGGKYCNYRKAGFNLEVSRILPGEKGPMWGLYGKAGECG